MQNSSKTTGIIVVVIIIIVGIWLMTRRTPSTEMPVESTTAQNQDQSGALSAGNSSASDAALNQDAAAIDAQLGTLNTENSAAQQ